MLPFPLFAVFAAIMLLAALGVILSRQAVHAALNLVLAFFTAACLWISLDAEFLGLVLVLVYVGAVMVLFLFVLMMLDFSRPVVQATSQPSYKLRAFFVMSCFVAEILTLLYIKGSSPMLPLDRLPWSIQNLALRLFNDYAFPFEVAGAILLFAMVAVIGLVKEDKLEDDVSTTALKRQNIADQVRVKKSDRLIVVKSS